MRAPTLDQGSLADTRRSPAEPARGGDLALAVALAGAAGELLLEYFGRIDAAEADRKGGYRRDLVSRADLEAERLVLAGIPEGEPVLAEESGRRAGSGERSWIVDPLDGTVNFLHRIPFWCVSIAVLREEELVAGVVHAPALGHTFTAARGSGSWCNGERLRVSDTAELSDALLVTGFAYDREQRPDNNLDNFQRLALAAAGVRRLGSAAIDLAYVASGRIDGFWELHLNPWDIAAGALLVREAGGRVSNFHGREGLGDVLGSRHLIASNGLVHEAIRGGLSPLRALR